MSPKYRVTERDRWGMLHPRLSDHVLERWDERTPDGARSPEFAFLYAEPVIELRGARHFHDSSKDTDADLIRVYHGQTADGERYAMVFLGHQDGSRDDVLITTVYNVEDVRSGPLRSYLWAVSHEAGGIVDEAVAPDPLADGIPEEPLPRRHVVDGSHQDDADAEVVA
jgi:hypothetical protein